jgi:hypothetical protein
MSERYTVRGVELLETTHAPSGTRIAKHCRMTSDILDQVFELDPNRVAAEAHDLPRVQQALLRLFDGVRSLASVVAASPLGPADTLEAIARLGARGLVRRRAGTPSPAHDEATFNDLEEEFFSRPPATDADNHAPAPRLLAGLLRR